MQDAIKDLAAIQSELNAPKGQYNEFGKYRYRSCEDILEALKPLLKKTGSALTLSDRIEIIEGRHYVRADACWYSKNGIVFEASAYAREEETKKGMDAAQITGSASSYARKYALNGLFLIDDAKDPDTRDNRGGDLQAARKRLEAAIQRAAKAQGRTVEDYGAGIRARSDFDWNDAEALERIAEEVEAV